MDARSETLVGVVTVLFNSAEFIDDFVAGLAAQRGVRLRLYAIENSATPETLHRLESAASAAGIHGEFLFNDANVGVAKANNQGIALALQDGCSHVLIANNDISLADGVLRALLHEVRDWSRAAAPRIVVAGSSQLWYAGGFIDAWTARAGHYVAPAFDPDRPPPTGDTGYAPTCFLLLHSDAFKRVGMMDEQYFTYYDDVDFAWRCRKFGITLRYVPSVCVDHKVGGSTGGSVSLFTLYNANRGRLYFIRKHFSGIRLLTALSYAVGTRILKSFLLGPRASRAMWRGVVDGWSIPVRVD